MSRWMYISLILKSEWIFKGPNDIQKYKCTTHIRGNSCVFVVFF